MLRKESLSSFAHDVCACVWTLCVCVRAYLLLLYLYVCISSWVCLSVNSTRFVKYFHCSAVLILAVALQWNACRSSFSMEACWEAALSNPKHVSCLYVPCRTEFVWIVISRKYVSTGIHGQLKYHPSLWIALFLLTPPTPPPHPAIWYTSIRDIHMQSASRRCQRNNLVTKCIHSPDSHRLNIGHGEQSHVCSARLLLCQTL